MREKKMVTAVVWVTRMTIWMTTPKAGRSRGSLVYDERSRRVSERSHAPECYTRIIRKQSCLQQVQSDGRSAVRRAAQMDRFCQWPPRVSSLEEVFQRTLYLYLSQDGTHAAEAQYQQFLHTLMPLVKYLQRLWVHLQNDDVTVWARSCLRNLQACIVDMTKALQKILLSTRDDEVEWGYSKFHMGAILIRDGFNEYVRLALANEIFGHLKDSDTLTASLSVKLTTTPSNWACSWRSWRIWVSKLFSTRHDSSAERLMKR